MGISVSTKPSFSTTTTSGVTQTPETSQPTPVVTTPLDPVVQQRQVVPTGKQADSRLVASNDPAADAQRRKLELQLGTKQVSGTSAPSAPVDNSMFTQAELDGLKADFDRLGQEVTGGDMSALQADAMTLPVLLQRYQQQEGEQPGERLCTRLYNDLMSGNRDYFQTVYTRGSGPAGLAESAESARQALAAGQATGQYIVNRPGLPQDIGSLGIDWFKLEDEIAAAGAVQP